MCHHQPAGTNQLCLNSTCEDVVERVHALGQGIYVLRELPTP